MKRFIIFRLALVFLMAAVDFISCSFFEPSDGANVSFTIDNTMAQKISEEAGIRLAGRSAARSLTADEMQGLYFEITLNGSHQDSKTVPVTENATITFENVPVGSSIYARGLAYKTDAGKKLVLYEGQSETIIVSGGTNALSLALRRSSYSGPIQDPDGAVYIYVSAIGSNNNDGSAEGQPVESIATAVGKINSLEDSDKDYVIVVDGTLQGRQKIAAAGTYSETGAALNVSAKSITIKGINSGTLDGNGTTPLTLNVSSDVPVTIKDLIITNSDADANNVGLEIKGGNIFIEDGTHITGNNGSGMDVSGANVTMNGGKISNNIQGNCSAPGVHLFGSSVFTMNGGEITGNTNTNMNPDYYNLSPGGVFLDSSDGDEPTFIMNGGSISGNTAEVGVSDVSVYNNDSTFKISGSASIGNLYLGQDTKILVISPLTGSGTVATIEPSLYEEGRQIIEIETGSGVNLAEAVSRFELKQPSDGSHWQIASDGTLTEGYETTISGLTSLLNSLAANSVESPYSVKITDSDLTNFAFANSNITNALAAVSVPKYIKLAFKNAGFSTISGNAALSPYITNLTIPSSVSEITFIDLGPNFTGFTVAEGNTTFTASDGILYQNSGRKIVRYPAAYPETTATIASNITAIADGAFAGCTNIASFSVASGNTYFKVISGEPNEYTDTYKARQYIYWFEADPSVGTEPDFSDQTAWNAWNNNYQKQYHSGYAPVPVLTSYDETTLIACPPAITLLTKADLIAKYGTKDNDGNDKSDVFNVGNAEFYFDQVRPYAFCGIKNLSSITVGVEATSVPAYTFKDCSALEYVYLSIAGSTIKPYTFSDCTALQGVNFRSETITTVQSNAFDGCTGLKSLYFQAGENTGRSGTASDAYPASCTVTISGYVA